MRNLAIPFRGRVVGRSLANQGGAAATFDPLTLTPYYWAKADAQAYSDAGTTLAGNNDTVRQWNDQSGNNKTASQGTAGARPTFKTNQQNGLPMLSCDGGDFMDIASPVTTAITNVSIFAVVKLADTSRHGGVILNGDAGYGIGLGGNWSDNNALLVGIFQNKRFLVSGTTLTSGVHLIELHLNASSVPTMYLDGVLAPNDLTGSDPNTPATNSRLFYDGDPARASNFLTGEILVAPLVTGTPLTNARAGFAARWGITI